MEGAPVASVRRRTILLYIAAGLTALFAIAAGYLQWKFQEPPLDRIKALPDFELTERSGAKVRLADLKGKVWLADFIYTTCPGPCPIISRHLAAMKEQALAGDGVRFVSISMDPESDTPAVLQKYAERFHAPADQWLFLTGDKQKVQDLVRNGFLLAMVDAQAQAGQPIIHSTKLALVDKQGVIRGFYEGVDGA